MENMNPYAAPKSEVNDKAGSSGRPGWVWAIFIFYLLGFVSMVASYSMIYSGALPLSEGQKAYFANLTVFDHLLSVVIMVINGAAAVALLRLRKISAYLFPAGFALSLMVTAWHAAAKGWLAAMENGITGAAVGWMISALICLYAWRLAKNGVLK